MTCGMILAAGLSSRMKDFKAMLPIGNTSFIKKIIHEMRDAGIREIVVVTGFRRDELESHIADEAVTCVFNERYDNTQMLDSLKLGLMALPKSCDKVLITPVDVVLPSLPVYRAVLSSEGDFARPVCRGKYGHPVAMRRSLFEFVKGYEGEGGLKGAVQKSGMSIINVPVEDGNISLDADTPEDYRKVVEKYKNRQ